MIYHSTGRSAGLVILIVVWLWYSPATRRIQQVEKHFDIGDTVIPPSQTNLEIPHLVFLVGTVIYGSIRLHFQRHCLKERKAIHKDNLLDWMLVWQVIIGQAVIPLILILTPWLDALNYELPGWTTIIGGPLMAFGLWLFWRSHADLGRSWSVSLKLNETHHLVTHGVYRFVRHPMYASFFVLGISQALILGNWLAGWSGLVATSVLYLFRRTTEEKMMLDHFGEEYVEYRRTTGGVLPRFSTLLGKARSA